MWAEPDLTCSPATIQQLSGAGPANWRRGRQGACPGRVFCGGGAWPRLLLSPRGVGEPCSAQSDADRAAIARPQACCAEQKAGKKGQGGKEAGGCWPIAKLVFATTSRARLGSFLGTSDRSGHGGSWWVRRSLSSGILNPSSPAPPCTSCVSSAHPSPGL